MFPLPHLSWWNLDQHCAALVVLLAAVLASALVFAAVRTGFRRWWLFVGSGIFAAVFPAAFYRLAAPANVHAPLTKMYLDGIVGGAIGAAVLNLLAKWKAKSHRPTIRHARVPFR
jgi:hypothetical protein